MKKLCALLFLNAFLFTCFCEDRVADGPIVERSNALAFKMFAELSKNKPNDNLMIAPLPIYMSLGILYAASEGDTTAELKEIAAMNIDKKEMGALFKDILKEIEEINKPKESEFTKYWREDLEELEAKLEKDPTNEELKEELERYKKIVKEYSERDIVSLKTETEIKISDRFKAEETVENFIKNNFNAKFQKTDFVKLAQDLENDKSGDSKIELQKKLRGDFLPENVALQMINTSSLDADWGTPYFGSGKYTENGSFFIKPTEAISVPMMQSRVDMSHFIFGASYQDKYDLVHLPLKGERMIMVILVPRHEVNLHDIIADLAKTQKLPAFNELEFFKDGAILRMPRFDFESTYIPLDKTMNALGMKKTFGGGSNILALFPDNKEPANINFLQNTKILVNETGVKASAATAMEISYFGISKPKLVRANKPFLFFLIEGKTNAIWFMGKLMDPSKN